ncbi:hypothetical protein M3Y99_01108300 [Aphelenchoides fujianensis]|nr:hypothetical protein M3Y99_01108300 [Aphelenchoides fujianensis]
MAEWILEAEPIFELSISLPTLLINFYFALRFCQLDCFSPNFRILLVGANICTSLCTVIHPLPQLWIAFKHRRNYEERDGTEAFRFLFYYLSTMVVFVTIKVSVMFYFSSDESMDDRLAFAFVPERCIYVFAPTTACAGLTWIIGCFQFYHLSRFAKTYRYRAQSLSESFLIKQIGHSVDVIIALLVAYLFAVIFSGTCMFIILYLYFWRGYGTTSTYYLIFANCAYYSVPLYTFFSTVYQMYYFSAMRRAVLNDLKSLFGIEIEITVHPQRVNAAQETKLYFEQLRELWK